MAVIKARGAKLYYEEYGVGEPILLVPPAGATASTWGSVIDDLSNIGRVVAYDRRGYKRSGGHPVHTIAEHTADAATVLEALTHSAAVVVGASVGATIAIDLARRRPEMVHTVIAYESPWRSMRYGMRHPNIPDFVALGRMEWLGWRGRHAEGAEVFLRHAYTRRDGTSAWDVFPEDWRRVARENGEAVIADVRIAIGGYPPPKELARITSPVVCAFGARSARYMQPITSALAHAIPGAIVREVSGSGHAIAFDAPGQFVQLITEAIAASGSGQER